MFSLIRFHNDKFTVQKSASVQHLQSDNCIVKCNGAKYAAFFVAKSDDKTKLLHLKLKKEKSFTSSKLKNKNSVRAKSLHNTSSPYSSDGTQRIIKSLRKRKTQNDRKTSSSDVNFLSNGPLFMDKVSPIETSFSHSNRTKILALSQKNHDHIDNTVSSSSSENLTLPHDLEISPNSTKTAQCTSLPLSTTNINENSAENCPGLRTKSFLGAKSFSNAASTSPSRDEFKLPVQIRKIENIFDKSQQDVKSLRKNKFQKGNRLQDIFIEPSDVFFHSDGPLLLKEASPENKTVDHANSINTLPLSQENYENIDIISSPNSAETVIFPYDLVISHNSITTSKKTSLPPSTTNITENSSKHCPDLKTKNYVRAKSFSNAASISPSKDEFKLPVQIRKFENTSSKNQKNVECLLTNKFKKGNRLPDNYIEPYDAFFHSDCPLLLEEASPVQANSQHATSTNTLTMSQENPELINITTSSNCSENLALPHELVITHNSTTSQNISLPLSTTNNTENSSQNCHDLSSECGETTINISEYIPDSSLDVSVDTVNKSNKTITDENGDVSEVDNPLDVNKILVPYSKTNKKHFCIFCKKLQSTLSRHLYLIHKDQKEVKHAFSFPKKSRERLNILNDIRKQGDFEHNTSEKYNSGVFIVTRQQQETCRNVVDDYVCCKTCKGFFSKKTIRIHKTKCGSSKNNRNNQIDSRRLTQFIHPTANKALKTKIFPVLRCDAVTQLIRYDELVIKFGNYLSEKYSLQHQHDMIRANLRLLGRFIIAIKKIECTITQLKDIYKTHLFDSCVKAIRSVANWNDAVMEFETPAVAQNLTSLIKKCGRRQRVEYIKEEREELKIEVENFLMLWEEEVPLLNKKASEDLCNQKRNKKLVLPSKDDIRKLYTYLRERISNTMSVIEENFTISTWTKLVEATLIFIQIFNRRRAGEIERLSVENYQNKEFITDIGSDIAKNISKESLSFAKQFVRISLRGKLGRTVNVLLSPMCIKAIDLILKFRKEAGVSNTNTYIFSKPHSTELNKPYIRACPLLKMFANDCGAQIPASLRGTTLRKHIATHTSLLNIEESSIDRLADFMGHNKDIHKNIYRTSIPVADITCVSKILMSAIGGGVENDEVESAEDSDYAEEEDITEFQESSKDTMNLSSSSNKKRRSKSPYGKTRRCRWSKSEKEAIFSYFGDVKHIKNLPSSEECRKVKRQSSALKNRTVLQIKSWIDNQRRQKITPDMVQTL